VPLPTGALKGSTGAAGQWSVLLVVDDGAESARAATVSLYLAHGYVAESDSVVRNQRYRVTVVAENRDHSQLQSNLAIGVTSL
jgi:hypothetical protein